MNLTAQNEPIYKFLIPMSQFPNAEGMKNQMGLNIEIGIGNGEYFTRNALKHPEQTFLGIECRWTYAARALRRIHQAGLRNAYVVWHDARVLFERYTKPNSLREITALFPCPWPKRRHIKYRLFSRDFLLILNNRLRSKGHVRIVTDQEAFKNWIMDQAMDTGFVVTSEKIPARLDTKYERKWAEEGQKQFFEVYLVKHQHHKLSPTDTPNMNTYTVNHFDPQKFHPEDVHQDVTLRFKEFLFDPKRERAMQSVVIVEGPLTQSVWIKIDRVGPIWRILPDMSSGVIPCRGLQLAIDHVQQEVTKTSS
ncbi:hypothetical protein IIB34_06200 [PVC group bacterium]|nr:hypothetical protein [PVC group bacterium]